MLSLLKIFELPITSSCTLMSPSLLQRKKQMEKKFVPVTPHPHPYHSVPSSSEAVRSKTGAFNVVRLLPPTIALLLSTRPSPDTHSFLPS
ncbi:hypothetical protein CDAR_621381 [Caerostris darwini]|uniref:Uncharacterized protein n=1 Tax=Caerostris darwini TaxID=1538125 RepID=A0AAV4S423_9ARAC|nr:hypothetical protein CDAR_621381 [Caerostris darwini]